MRQKLSLFFICLFVVLISCSRTEKEAKEIQQIHIEKQKPHALLITDSSGIDDRSFNAAAFSGLMTYYSDSFEEQRFKGIYYDVFQCSTNEQVVKLIEEAAAGKKYQLIITPGESFSEALVFCAKKYPEQKFMFIDTIEQHLPNVIEFTFSEEQGSFLVGAAAALQAQLEGVKNPSFGFIGGEQSIVITKFQIGFIQGVRTVLPDAVIEEYYTNSWNRPDLAEDKSSQWYESGMYAIFSAAGASGLGTINSAKKFRQRGYNVWALGVDSDQFTYGLYAPQKSAVLTSMIKDVGKAVVYSLNMMEAGNFVNGSLTFDLLAEGVTYTKTNPELLPEVILSLEKIKKSILDGKITIYSSYKEAQRAGVVKDLTYAVYE